MGSPTAARSSTCHSPWSHDACDNGEGAVNEACLDDLRNGLCTTRTNAAFATDHSAYAAEHPYEDLFNHRDGDTWIDVGGVHRANEIACDNGHRVLYLPGIEDELMPVGLDEHVAGADAAENDRIYDAASLTADAAVGAGVFVAHT